MGMAAAGMLGPLVLLLEVVAPSSECWVWADGPCFASTATRPSSPVQSPLPSHFFLVQPRDLLHGGSTYREQWALQHCMALLGFLRHGLNHLREKRLNIIMLIVASGEYGKTVASTN